MQDMTKSHNAKLITQKISANFNSIFFTSFSIFRFHFKNFIENQKSSFLVKLRDRKESKIVYLEKISLLISNDTFKKNIFN